MYVGTADGKVRSFPISGCGQPTYAPAWTSTASGAAISSQPVVAGGVVYAGTAAGRLAAYATSNGSSLYSTTVDAAALTVNVIEDGSTVYVTTSTGKVAAYRSS